MEDGVGRRVVAEGDEERGGGRVCLPPLNLLVLALNMIQMLSSLLFRIPLLLPLPRYTNSHFLGTNDYHRYTTTTITTTSTTTSSLPPLPSLPPTLHHHRSTTNTVNASVSSNVTIPHYLQRTTTVIITTTITRFLTASR